MKAAWFPARGALHRQCGAAFLPGHTTLYAICGARSDDDAAAVLCGARLDVTAVELDGVPDDACSACREMLAMNEAEAAARDAASVCLHPPWRRSSPPPGLPVTCMTCGEVVQNARRM